MQTHVLLLWQELTINGAGKVVSGKSAHSLPKSGVGALVSAFAFNHEKVPNAHAGHAYSNSMPSKHK